MKRILNLTLCAVLFLSLLCPALAVESQADIAMAAAYAQEKGILTGDAKGNLMLDKGLSRAEMAVILTRLHGEGEVNPDHYTWACYFQDVPNWARPYVGYCVAQLLVAGYDETRYGPGDPVTPAMACTVILRTCGYKQGEETDWTYRTACDYAVRLGLISQSTAEAGTITRGEMAVLIYRAQQRQGQAPEIQPDAIPQADGITIAPDGIVTSKVITQPAWSREDFSQQANPAIFTGCYTREWYNLLRQSIVDRDLIAAGNNEDNLNPKYLYAHALVPDRPMEQFNAFSSILGQIYGLYYYSLSGEPYTKNQYEYPGYTIVKVDCPDSLQQPLEYIQPLLTGLSGQSDREKVTALNHYLCEKLDYGTGKSASLAEIFSDNRQTALGQCGNYASAFKFLCGAAGIPCISVLSENHAWNEVYVDGQWLTVDVTFNDASAGRNRYLLIKESSSTDIRPEGTRFAKELLVPGSTK